MKQIDFSQPGGFPLTQDTLDFMQQAYTETIKAIAALGLNPAGIAANTPYIISGMSIAGSVYKSGWFYYNGDLVQFPNDVDASGLPALPPGGVTVYGFQITESDTPLLFNNGSSPSVLKVKTASIAAGTVISPTFIPLSSNFYSYPQMFQEQNWTHMPVAAIGAITGDVYYRKNYFSNTLHIMGSISITASATPTPPEYIAFALLPAGYRPLSADVPFKAFFRYHLSTLEDASSLDYIRDMNMELTTTGNLSIGLIKPAANCIVSFNTILPLD